LPYDIFIYEFFRTKSVHKNKLFNLRQHSKITAQIGTQAESGGDNMANIAFVGLGNMGAPMANNLIKAGHHLCVFDIDLKRMQAVSQAQAATSAHEAIVAADFIISMLPESRHVQALYLTDQKLLEHITPNAVVIDCSTISPATSRQVASAAAARGIAMLDAPVSGGTNGAAAGSLTFMVGGDQACLQKARPLLEVMGKNIFHAGGARARQVAKNCQQHDAWHPNGGALRSTGAWCGQWHGPCCFKWHYAR